MGEKGKSFMEAGTEIGALVEAREDDLNKIANILSIAVISKIKANTTNNISVDVEKIICELADSDQKKVLLRTLENIARNFKTGSGKSESRPKQKSYMDDIFRGR